uniref:Probable RNA polymerase II nuclear localization protein SLC7A6OS n=1 Tax=Panagrolaimus sp. ES5 TaxID=591445 RepID=A0AC34FQJ8_9BILA
MSVEPEPVIEQEEEQVQIPLSTVIRIRRKRGAPPSSDWVVASKRNRVEGEEESGENSRAVFKLAATADKPSISAISNVIQPSKVSVVEYDLINGVINKPQIIDKHQEQINEAADMVEKMDFTESSSSKNEAPLASNESLDDDHYVYDFYAPSQSTFLNFDDDLVIRHITDEERQLMFVDDGSDDSEPDLDDPDSNDENDYRNEYPDEGEFDEEHDTTSEDDFDHFGDADENYNDYLEEDD